MDKRILIVMEAYGGPGGVSRETYASFVSSIKTVLEKEKIESWQSALVVKIVETKAQAEEALEKRQADAVIFISSDMGDVAEKLAATYPRTRFFVFTGLIPKGKVVWIDKGRVGSTPEMVRAIVRGSLPF